MRIQIGFGVGICRKEHGGKLKELTEELDCMAKQVESVTGTPELTQAVWVLNPNTKEVMPLLQKAIDNYPLFQAAPNPLDFAQCGGDQISLESVPSSARACGIFVEVLAGSHTHSHWQWPWLKPGERPTLT